MAVNGKRFAFKFQHLDTDPDLEKAGVETPIGDSDVVLMVSRAGGRNYGFDAHREAVAERWRKTHGRSSLKGDELRAFNRDVFSFCITGWNEAVVGEPYSPEAARDLIELEVVYATVVDRAASMEAYRKAKVDDAKDVAGNA